MPAVLAIAGSDSGGGAGIQADLKAIARCGAHGMTAITALTAQNTTGVDAITPTPPEMIVAQVRTVASDIGVDAVKIGMLGDEPTIAAVVESLDLIEQYRRGVPVVVDPVMVSESGATLLEPNAKAALIERILPRATVVTPNLREALELAGRTGDVRSEELGEAILALGPRAVIVTGGHVDDGADVLVDDDGSLRIDGPRYPDGAAHGSAARTPRRSPHCSRAAWSCPTRRAGRAKSPPRPSATACVSSARARPRRRARGQAARDRAAATGLIRLGHTLLRPMSQAKTALPRPRSAAVFDGPDRAAARAYMKGIGFDDDALSRPTIGVANTWIEAMPCNFHLRGLAEHVKAGVRAAGGTPMEFNTVAISDGITMGTKGMKTSLVSREVIADSIELTARGYQFDADRRALGL